MNDPIIDMLNRIKNAQAVLKETAVIPFSNIKYEIAKILEKEGFVKKVEKRGRKDKKFLEIYLNYYTNEEDRQNKRPAVSGAKRISKLGKRIYKGSKDIKMTKGGDALVIVSTSKGLMTGKEARQKKIGGEVVCEIW